MLRSMTRLPILDQDGHQQVDTPHLRWSVWRRWTLANTIGETIGLSATLLLGVLLFAQLEPRVGALIVCVIGVLAGACLEGGVVGTAQWLVLHQSLTKLAWRSWVAATAIGAGIAWALGLLPSTMASLGASPEQSPATSVPDVAGLAFYALAAGWGFVAGAILAVAQWRVLRRFVPAASWWILANACAWALGMVLVFFGTSFIPASGVTAGVALILVAFVVATGAVVGATHGLALIWFLRERERKGYNEMRRVVVP